MCINSFDLYNDPVSQNTIFILIRLMKRGTESLRLKITESLSGEARIKTQRVRF